MIRRDFFKKLSLAGSSLLFLGSGSAKVQSKKLYPVAWYSDSYFNRDVGGMGFLVKTLDGSWRYSTIILPGNSKDKFNKEKIQKEYFHYNDSVLIGEVTDVLTLRGLDSQQFFASGRHKDGGFNWKKVHTLEIL